MPLLDRPYGQACRPSAEAVLFGGFCGLLVLAAVFAWVPPGRSAGAAVLLVFTALLGSRTSALPGAGLGLLAWVFYLGFVVHSDGELGRPTTGALLLLAALTATAVASAAAAALCRRSAGRRARPGEPRDEAGARGPTAHRRRRGAPGRGLAMPGLELTPPSQPGSPVAWVPYPRDGASPQAR